MMFFIIIILKNKNNGKLQINNEKNISIYTIQSNKICKNLDKAIKYYKKKNYDKAYNLVDDSYWNIYDNILEIKYRSYATPAKIFTVEKMFHSLAENMKKPISKDQLESNITDSIKLCNETKNESKILIKNSGE